ncbi:hypothetical protein SAMN04488513_108139 [Pseudozobellia thermophila]|uniref:Uncharacterized protein n=2 Tax=Pseudozobellia thermophila TaxID=192903 RepID=A0A1M6M1Z6_9FLAO|nr:hypothetical protein SAMN04488513_108139 [Pseudozobellia thermophila]
MFQKITILIILIFSLSGCHMKSQIVEFKNFQELNNNPGSENYEIIEIVGKKAEVSDFFGRTESIKIAIDTTTATVLIRAYEIKGNSSDISGTYIADLLGSTIKKRRVSGRVLKDGTAWETNAYNNWIINGDTAKHKYIDPFSKKIIDTPHTFQVSEKDPEKWLAKFKELYQKAQYIYIFMRFYYFKLDNKWYFMEANLEGLPDNFKQQYPPKEDSDVRMVELENLAPVWYHKGFKDRDTSLIKMVDYESTYFEKVDQGLNQYGFSAGWWYLEIPMPLGDTIRIKRYSNYEDPELKLYKVPKEYGGREDVLFIVQKPEELFPEQVGGMYAIRPRDPNQPQRRYKKIVYKTDSEGNETIDRSRSIETEEYKQWKKDKK